MITLSNVYKSYANAKAYSVCNVSFHVNRGETLVILGSSGSGKTTVLKMINRLIEPTQGEIKINDQNIQDIDPVKLRRSIGYVFQKIGLFPHLTVVDNVAIVLQLENVAKDERLNRAYELLSFVNLEPEKFAHRYPSELSGGQQQRVGVARALANQADILLMDEPFGALDSINRDNLQQEFMQLKKQLNKTVVFVTHDVFEALRLADRIAVMNKGELLQIGPRDELLNAPANDFVASLFQKTADQVSFYTETIEE